MQTLEIKRRQLSVPKALDMKEGLLCGAEHSTSLARNSFRRFGESVHEAITFLSQRQLGTEIGSPQRAMPNIMPDGDPTNYRSQMYVLPLPAAALLMLPRNDESGQKFDFLIVRPDQSEEFNNYFAPSVDPLRIEAWRPRKDESVRESFLREIHLFPVDVETVEEVTTDDERDGVYLEALRTASQLKFASIIRGDRHPTLLFDMTEREAS